MLRRHNETLAQPRVTPPGPATYHFYVARMTPLRLAVAALTFALAVVAVAWVATYREFRPYYGAAPPSAQAHYPSPYVSPAWTAPVAALIGIAAAGAVVLVFRRSRQDEARLPDR